MKTRVRPLREECLHNWLVEIHDPVLDKWVGNSEHDLFWRANWRAHRLSKYSLDTKMNRKEEFVRKLKEGENDSEI